ncbi:flagellar protein FliS [Ruminiclostridium sufflavum DSM 19573]|uniref:Flagellar secretion chaperone FliS n=1 Tax=Ruminiclostridium sufflavum DSM 19573 TaxID=1121337 RepID=A0A318XPP0_9FIRM|nr:flagellar export chaperone FliS [Ruminiclostridium sufflavum]PYG89128.1 flagellar protein FliS [Ruminiclostridium sufflavum DSM 19573]
MVTSNGFNQYKESSIKTSTPEELTLMLYNGLVKFLLQAQNAIETGNIEKASNSIIRAQAIISEFKATLDMNYEVSEGLNSLYDYMHRQLVEANIKKNVDIIAEILGYSKELRDTWAQAMKIAKNSVQATEKMAK